MKEIKYEIRENTYYDSITLMLITKEIEKIEGVQEALVGMGTDLNKELADNLGIMNQEIEKIGVNDFFISTLADADLEVKKITDEVDRILSRRKEERGTDYMPPTMDSALRHKPQSNIVLISIAGEYATEEARKALDNDLHIMLFSDNVSLEDEKMLKEIAQKKGLLIMGPDCGTAIINNVPLAFANVINRGNIGIIGASGTGIQEIGTIIDKLGGGISHAIGTGGRDLYEEIGGITMLQGLEALEEDARTEIIVLVSKPPSKIVANKILDAIEGLTKPVIINFIGGHVQTIEKHDVYRGISLEDTARKAMDISKGERIRDFYGFDEKDEIINKMVEDEIKKMAVGQRHLRGLFTGGTLAYEAMDILNRDIGVIYSNISKDANRALENLKSDREHICMDLGGDEFTRGRPHPMIDPSVRAEYLIDQIENKSIAVILLDFVLGFGAHKDPVGEMIPAIAEIKRRAAEEGRYVSIVASICGTERDPQDLNKSKKRLMESGVIVMPSNAQAAQFASLMLKKVK